MVMWVFWGCLEVFWLFRCSECLVCDFYVVVFSCLDDLGGCYVVV